MRYRLAYIGIGLLLLLGSCDTSITGVPLENIPPETEMNVRDSSLVDNFPGDHRLPSTVFVSWSGTDPDGYVVSYELRYFFPDSPPGPSEGWISTTANDTLILLPIPPGERFANVTFEVRAIDNEGARDPSPAHTVFPIQNAPPDLRLSPFELPPDTTFTVVSFSWQATDPEGEANLARIEISLNDSTSFVGIPPDVDFITLVGQYDREQNPEATEVEARVYLGRGFEGSSIYVPGMRLDAPNTFYARAVDQTDTTSAIRTYEWYVKKPRSEILYVNDWRKANWPNVQRYHLNILRSYLPEGTPITIWDISQPYATGSAGAVQRSPLLPEVPDPTLRQTLALFKYIYWVTTNSTNSTVENNLPYAASVMDAFFEQGGKLMVHTPVSLPPDPEQNLENAAIFLLPISDLISFPDTLRPTLRMPRDSVIQVLHPLPGTGERLPPLKPLRTLTTVLPFEAEGENIIPLYQARFMYITKTTRRMGIWPGPSYVASISADRRVAVMAIPLVSDQNGEDLFIGADGDPDAPEEAVRRILRSLGFPEQ